MGCTLTMALVISNRAYIANVGDSRTYIQRQTGLHQISKDHSVIANLIENGMAQPEEIYTHPDRNIVYLDETTNRHKTACHAIFDEAHFEHKAVGFNYRMNSLSASHHSKRQDCWRPIALTAGGISCWEYEAEV